MPTSLRFRIQEVNWMSKLNLDRTSQTTFPVQNYIAQFSLNYIYTHGDQSSADFKVLSLRNCYGWNMPILFSRMLYILLLLMFLEQNKFTVCWTYRIFWLAACNGWKIRTNSSQRQLRLDGSGWGGQNCGPHSWTTFIFVFFINIIYYFYVFILCM